MIFRRIHGRIIPIKEDREKKKGLALGAAGVAAGAAVGHQTGKMAGSLMEESAFSENIARDLIRSRQSKMADAVKHGPLFAHSMQSSTENMRLAATRNLKRSKQIEKAVFRLRNAGTVASAALIAGGVHKALENSGYKENKKTNAAISAGSGVGAAFVIRSSYLRRVGVRGFDVVKQAARRAFLKL